jgi:hypothetical protein
MPSSTSSRLRRKKQKLYSSENGKTSEDTAMGKMFGHLRSGRPVCRHPHHCDNELLLLPALRQPVPRRHSEYFECSHLRRTRRHRGWCSRCRRNVRNLSSAWPARNSKLNHVISTEGKRSGETPVFVLATICCASCFHLKIKSRGPIRSTASLKPISNYSFPSSTRRTLAIASTLRRASTAALADAALATSICTTASACP